MLAESALRMLALFALGAPAAAFLGLGLFMLLGRTPGERAIGRITGAALVSSLLASLPLACVVFFTQQRAVALPLAQWFHIADYGFPLGLYVDRLSASMMLLTTVICGLIGRFSVRYMHRDRGFARFFLLLYLFTAAMLLLTLARSVDLLFMGWELVGICSGLLIAHFRERRGPAQSGLRALIIYRVCDLGLLLGAALLHHFAQSPNLDVAFGIAAAPPGAVHALSASQSTLLAFLFLFAALGKSAQVPFTGWLPRAMEGPTPSSALFYGALSIHAGVYLLLRLQPLYAASRAASLALVLVGLLTALHGFLVSRVKSDAKSALAYATVTQVGLMFAEVGLGWHRLAAFHLVAHACFRTLELLTAPSLLHMVRKAHAAAGEPLRREEARLLPFAPRLDAWLYRAALEHFYLDDLLDELIVKPGLRLARVIDRLQRGFVELFLHMPDGNSPTGDHPPHTAAAAEVKNAKESTP
jgi:NADH:ubiquinone oxidoreductase subunit 5 (subunit L)/multisubunit Na+/H+ antiporter MnhA subunit